VGPVLQIAKTVNGQAAWIIDALIGESSDPRFQSGGHGHIIHALHRVID
jgi:hypothetical protein